MKVFPAVLFSILFLIPISSDSLVAQDSKITTALRSREKAVFKENQNLSDLVILDEQHEIEIIDQRAGFMWFKFTKDQRIQIQTKKGLSRISCFKLPEPYDPTYIAHFPPIRNYRQLFSRIKDITFSVTVTKSDGRQQILNVFPEILEDSVMMLEEEYFGVYKEYLYQLRDIEVGDILNIHYSFQIPNKDNMAQMMSFRQFLHSADPKVKSRFSLIHHKELFLEINYLNGAEPDTIFVSDRKKHYVWTRDSLAGCLNEIGNQPYMELPNIVFTAKPYDFWYYTVPKSFEPRFIPNYVTMADHREEHHLAITLSTGQKVNTSQYIQIRNFVNKQSRGLNPVKDRIEIMKRVHHEIVDHFDYRDNIEFMTREDIRDPEIGDQIGSRTLTDLARNDLYLALILTQNLNYCTTYLSDNRSGELSEFYFAPIRDNDFIYTVFYGNDSVHWYYPKKSRFGYYQDELPFYYENTNAQLVHVSNYYKKDERMDEEFMKIVFPASPLSYNSRRSNVMASVNLNDLSLRFDAQVSLSGQFSTMTRGLYLYDYHHPTIDRKYHQKIWEIHPDVEVLKQDVSVKSNEAPFTTLVNASYTSNELLKESGDTLVLNLNNWFNHLIPDHFDAATRVCTYHPDFAFKDSYSYLLRFSEDVKLLNQPEPIDINGDQMMMTIEMQQLDPSTIKLDSYLSLFGDIAPTDSELLEQFFDHLSKLNQSTSLKFVRK